MRIGILTFHYVSNYGAVIQCYALSHFLAKLGHEVEVIDYRPWRTIPRVHGLRRVGGVFIDPRTAYTTNVFRLPPFERFLNRHLPLSKQTYRSSRSLRNKHPHYDLYIAGSDQIWNPYIHKPFDPSYLFDFVEEGDNVCVAYAASFGGASIPDALRPRFIKLLSRFKQISVREMQGKQVIEDLCGAESEIVLDPTFLLEDYSCLAEHVQENRPYIAVYSVYPSSEFAGVVEYLRRRTGLPVIAIGNELSVADCNRTYIGPTEWLGYLKNASYIVTNSFHGTALSIIMGKQFFVYKHKPKSARHNRGKFVRISELLSELGLESRIVYDDSLDGLESLSLEGIDYGTIQSMLQRRIGESKHFLSTCLESS